MTSRANPSLGLAPGYAIGFSNQDAGAEWRLHTTARFLHKAFETLIRLSASAKPGRTAGQSLAGICLTVTSSCGVMALTRMLSRELRMSRTA